MSRQGKCLAGNGKKQRVSWRMIILMVLFCICFVASALQVSGIMMEKRAAVRAYTALRLETQKIGADTIRRNEGSDKLITLEIPKTSDAREPSSVSAKQKTMDFSALREQTPNMAAWLTCEGTNIDYPVMHTDNNEYYLNHLYNGDANGSGALFIDYRNSGLFTDNNTVIYGHHMQNGTMFSSLMEYKSQDFYDTHPTMILYTPDGDFLIELICGTVEDGNFEFVQFEFTTEQVFEDYISDLKRKSTFNSQVMLQPDDRIISLCTCSYEWSNARYMLIGKMTPLYL